MRPEGEILAKNHRIFSFPYPALPYQPLAKFSDANVQFVSLSSTAFT
jgi:hypothetical protein